MENRNLVAEGAEREHNEDELEQNRLLHGGSLGVPDPVSSGITDVIIGMRLLIRMCRSVEDVQN